MNTLEALLITLIVLAIANIRTRLKRTGLSSERVLILKTITISGLFASLYLLYSISVQVAAEGVIFDAIGSGFMIQTPLNLRIDGLGLFMASIGLSLTIFVTLYSFTYMEDVNADLYYILLIAMTIGIIGVFFAADFLTLFIFWELMTLPSYGLILFGKRSGETIEATVKYTVMSVFGNALILLAMSFVYGMTGSLSFPQVAQLLPDSSNTLWVSLSAILFITGFGVKASIFPLHTWLPDAHPAAPSPISALLSGVMISSGMYVITRVMLTVFPMFFKQWALYLTVISVITMSVGNLLAYRQQDVKRLLAYSSVAHMGYILSGISTGTRIGFSGAFFHILNHAFMKALAFLCVGAYILKTDTRELDGLVGVGRRMPVTTICLSTSLFALMGIPPFSGFLSEVLLVQSNLAIGNALVAAAIVVNSIIGSIYYARLLQRLIARNASPNLPNNIEEPIMILLPLLSMTTILVLLTVFSDNILTFLQDSLTQLY